MTTHEDQVIDPLYWNWVKGGLGLKYLTEGLESFVDDTIRTVQTRFLDDIRRNTPGLQEVKCTECTTANVLPCPTPDMCNLRKGGGICSYHDKTDKLKTSRPCPNSICDRIREKISHQHRFPSPLWKNTNAQNWCTNHFEIGKCFLPKSGYENKTSTSETDSSGLLNISINCLPIQNRLDVQINPPNDILSKLVKVRNSIFHSASCTNTKEQLDSYIDDMVTLLEDKKTLLDCPNAKSAVLKLKQLKNGDFRISTKDELEIRVRALRAVEEKTAEAIQTIKHKQEEAIDAIEHTQETKKRKLSVLNEDLSHSNNSQYDELQSSIKTIQSTHEAIQGSLEILENKLKYVEKNQEITEATLTSFRKDVSDFKEAMKASNTVEHNHKDEIEYRKRKQSSSEDDFNDDYEDDDNDGDNDDDDENEAALCDYKHSFNDDDDDNDDDDINDNQFDSIDWDVVNYDFSNNENSNDDTD